MFINPDNLVQLSYV